MVSRSDWEKHWRKAASPALDSVHEAASLDDLEALRLELLGRKGSLTTLLKSLKDLPLEARRELGGPANELKVSLEAALEARRKELEKKRLDREVSESFLDATLPGSAPASGRLHPLTRALDEIAGIFGRLGFSWAEGPLVETEHYNFDALNIPADHPARDMQDTFYVKPGPGAGTLPTHLLRTHTSPVQIRAMESRRPPLRIIVPGRVFRHEAVDASHSAVFHQVEGLYVDKGVSMADLKGTLVSFLQTLYGPQTQTRLRPSYFPFTEPSAEVDIRCVFCAGSGCGVCKRSGWLEVMGCGLVAANVFKAVGYNPELWSGFAFGMGVERMAMLRLGIDDIRMFYENDVRFLEQF